MHNNFSFESIISVIKELGGYFTFSGSNGEEYVVISKNDFEKIKIKEEEVQLELAPLKEKHVKSADAVLEKINRDIAIFQLQQNEEDSEIGFDMEREILESVEKTLNDQESYNKEDLIEPPKRVRFEPLRGDLPPELQD